MFIQEYLNYFIILSSCNFKINLSPEICSIFISHYNSSTQNKLTDDFAKKKKVEGIKYSLCTKNTIFFCLKTLYMHFEITSDISITGYMQRN